MALSKARNTSRFGAANEVVLSSLALPQKGGTTIYDGALVAIAAGYVEPFVAGKGLIAAGKASLPTGQPSVSAVDGDTSIRVEQGVFAYAMGTSANALTQADVGKPVYGSDDLTVNRTDGGGLWSVAGQMVGLKSSTEAYVFVAMTNQDLSQFGSNPEEITTTAQTLSAIIPTTRLTISGSMTGILPDGTRSGQRKRVSVKSVASTPSYVLTPTHASSFTTVTFGAGSTYGFVDFEWDNSLGTPAWKVVGMSNAGGTVTIA